MPEHHTRGPQPAGRVCVTKKPSRGRGSNPDRGAESEAVDGRQPRETDDLKPDVLANLRELQAGLANIDQGYHKKLYRILADAYEDAQTLNRRRSAWVEFRQEPFWEQCKVKPTESENLNAIMLWVLRFIFQAASTKGTQYNRAYKHARTLQGYAREGVLIEEVAAKLAEEGADYAFRHETKKNPRRTRVSTRPNRGPLAPFVVSGGLA